jgi:hypothetical protein
MTLNPRVAATRVSFPPNPLPRQAIIRYAYQFYPSYASRQSAPRWRREDRVTPPVTAVSG